MTPNEITAQLISNTKHIFTEADLLEKIDRAHITKKALRIKFGADPSSPDLHLGHAVVLKKLRQFQSFGHKVVLIIGDFTATIGDPTGKSKTRPVLTIEQTRTNAKTYVEQVSRILETSSDLLEIRYNSEWLSKVDLSEIISITASATVAQILQREDFANRYSAGSPIGLHELLYPLLQAHDSWAISADVELGGSDQLFNCLMGRAYSRIPADARQVVMLTPLLRGTDGNEKMSKSLGNDIGIAAPPAEMYEKLMKLPDALLEEYFAIFAQMPMEEAQQIISKDPYEAHKILARDIVTQFHTNAELEEAEERYRAISSNVVPDKMETFILEPSELNDGQISLGKLAKLSGIAASTSEAQRLATAGALFVNEKVHLDGRQPITVANELVIRRGRNRFVRVVLGR